MGHTYIHTYIRICRCVSINRCPEQILKEVPMETFRIGLYEGFVSMRCNRIVNTK